MPNLQQKRLFIAFGREQRNGRASLSALRIQPKSVQKTQAAALFKNQKLLARASFRVRPRQVSRLTGGTPDYGNGCCDGFSPNFPLIQQAGTGRAEM